VCRQSRSLQPLELSDCSVSSCLPVPPTADFRLAPDVVLRLPASHYFQLAPVVLRVGQTYLLPRLSPLQSFCLDWRPNFRPSPKIDLQLACINTSGSHRMRLALASPVFAASGLHRLPQPPAKLATSLEFQPVHASFGLRRQLPIPCIRRALSPPNEPAHGLRLSPSSEFRFFR